MANRVEIGFVKAALVASAALLFGSPVQSVGDELVTGMRGQAAARSVVSFSDLARQKQPTGPSRSVRPAPRPLPRPVGLFDLDAETAPALSVEPRDTLAPSLPPVSSPSPTLSFAALDDPGFVIPPDTQGAVGPGHLMVTLNSEVRVQDRTGGTISTVFLDSFWTSVGFDPFDPKVLYDPYADRWVFTVVAERRSATSSVFIGVSQTSDPTGLWNLYRVDADANDAWWADYPSMGFNKDWIVVQVNMFTNSTDAFARSHIFVFDKADLYSGGAGQFTLFAEFGFTQAPALTYDNGLGTLYLLSVVGSNVSGNGVLRLDRVEGSVGDEVFTSGPLISAPAWGVILLGEAPQLGSNETIDPGDDRMLGLVYRNGSLWAAHMVPQPGSGLPTRSSVQWWQLSTDGTVLQRGLIDDPSNEYFFAYPSIAVNRNNDLLIGYSRFSANEYAGGNYSFRAAGDPPNTLRSDTVLKAGEAPYVKKFGGDRNRWGDYSNTVVDPANDLDLWTIQEYADSPANFWATWWGMISPPCGDGSTDPEDECDDGNVDPSDGCTNNCTICGNTIVTAPEECDDGGLVDDDGCDSNCTFTGCGNGIVTSGESCDDGNVTDNDGCDSNCTPTGCGNNVLTPDEQCDDGNLIDDDGCDSNCTLTGCPNGIITAGEACDDGNEIDGDGCDSNCTFTACGNGVLTVGEECDDGNLVDDDGCDSVCQLDIGYACPAPGSPCELAHYVAYRIAAPRRDAGGGTIDNRFPRNWVITVDDVHLDNGSPDDPENFEVKRASSLLLPARKNEETAPDLAGLHYVRYHTRQGKETVGPAVGGGFPRPAKHVARVWNLQNQFGTINVRSKKVTAMLLPANKDLVGSPSAPADTNHFVCYRVTVTRDVTEQTPETRPGSGRGRFRKDLQAFFEDQFDDCAEDEGGGPSFAGTAVEGMCLLDLKRVKELCSPMNKSAVVSPRETSATLTPSTASTTMGLLCYQARLARQLSSQAAAAMANTFVGARIEPAQSKHQKLGVKTGDPVHIAPGNQFPNPILANTKKKELVCVPTEVQAVSIP